MSGLVVHRLSREMPGRWLNFPLPLCWDAPTKSKPDHDDDHWWVAWDHEAVDPTSLVFATSDEAVNCPDCLEWVHA